MNVVFFKRVFTDGPNGREPSRYDFAPVAVNSALVATVQPNASGDGTFLKLGGDGPAVLVNEPFGQVIIDLDLANSGKLPPELAHDPERRAQLREAEARKAAEAEGAAPAMAAE